MPEQFNSNFEGILYYSFNIDHFWISNITENILKIALNVLN